MTMSSLEWLPQGSKLPQNSSIVPAISTTTGLPVGVMVIEAQKHSERCPVLTRRSPLSCDADGNINPCPSACDCMPRRFSRHCLHLAAPFNHMHCCKCPNTYLHLHMYTHMDTCKQTTCKRRNAHSYIIIHTHRRAYACI